MGAHHCASAQGLLHFSLSLLLQKGPHLMLKLAPWTWGTCILKQQSSATMLLGELEAKLKPLLTQTALLWARQPWKWRYDFHTILLGPMGHPMTASQGGTQQGFLPGTAQKLPLMWAMLQYVKVIEHEPICEMLCVVYTQPKLAETSSFLAF